MSTIIRRAISFLFLLPVLLPAQQALTLEECLQTAFANSNLLRQADFFLAAAEERRLQNVSRRLPTVSARGSYLRVGKVSSFSIPMGPGGALREFRFGTPNRVNADLNLGLPLFSWGRINRQIEAATLGVDLSRQDRRQKALEVTDQVLRAYYSILLNQEAIAAAEKQLERAEAIAESARRRYASGHAAKLELLRAEVQATNACTQLDEARAALEKSNLWLAKVIGRPEEQVRAVGTLPFSPVVVDVEELINRTLERPDVKMVRLQQDILRRQSQVIAASLRPMLTGVAAYSVQNGFSPMNPDEFVDNWNVGVQLSLPLFDGGLTRHQVQETEKQIAALYVQEQEIREQLVVQIRQAFLTLTTAEQKAAVQQQNIVAAREALESAEQQYAAGRISSLDLIAAQQALAEAELLYLRALFAHLNAKLDLCRAAGDYTLFDVLPQKN